MMLLERGLIELLLSVVTREELNAFLRSPQNTAALVGGLIAVCGALLGAFLLLRGMALTSDAISHTVLLGIVVAFLLMTEAFGLEGDTSSPWLILGASLAGVAYGRADGDALPLGPGQAGCRAGLGLSAALRDRRDPGLALRRRCTPGRRRGAGGRDRPGLGQYQQPLLRPLPVGHDYARSSGCQARAPMRQLPRAGHQPAR